MGEVPLMTENGGAFSFIFAKIEREESAMLDTRFEEVPEWMIDAPGFSEMDSSVTKLGLITSDFGFSYLFEKERLSKMNPFPTPFRLPPIVQAPHQSNLPDLSSLFMLSIGILALLGWSKRKRNKQRVGRRSMA